MNAATEYVYDAIINYEPTYRALQVAVQGLQADELETDQARDVLLDQVHADYDSMGLTYDEIDNTDVDYIGLILQEAGLV